MAKRKTTKTETDNAYILKLILFIILGALWLRIGVGTSDTGIPVPIGFLIGLMFARHDRFQIDRKIEYAVLVCSMFVSFFLPFGLVVSL